MTRLKSNSIVGSGVLTLAFVLGAIVETPPANDAIALEARAVSVGMKECVAREQQKGIAGKEAATLACREQQEAEQLREQGPHSSSEVTVNTSPTPTGKMSASGHSSHSGNSGTEPSHTIQESKNSSIQKL